MVRAAGGKNVWLMGGGELVGQFYDHGLLDEIHVQIGSVTLGAGKPLLPRRITKPALELVLRDFPSPVRLDESGKIAQFRTRLSLSFKYDG